MNRSALLGLLTRYEAHTCTPAEIQLVEQWYELLGEPIEIPLSEEQWLIMEQKLWSQVQPQSQLAGADPVPFIRPLWRQLAVAASGIAAAIAIVIGLNGNQKILPNWFGPQSLIDKVEQAQWTQFVNQTDKSKEVKLPDGSIVVLSPHAQLAMHKDFNQKTRDVRLLGEASFRVHRDPSRPFLVYSGDIITKVLGTTFLVRTGDPGQPIQVIVQSGKVTVYRQTAKDLTNVSPNRGVILTPNQKATYFPDNEQFVTSIAEDPQPIVAAVSAAVAAPSLEFEDTPIGQVIHQLEVIYGTEIELEQESLSHCPFTGNLTHQALFTKLELLCGTINGSYEVRGTKILITGKGCQ
ncbi:FecR family protein [Dyadobacter pollutisoli]|jgi:ferric-dicitrate binding protein FerR (iron transport regulator)|uniref:FecR domain-containing protein n=1 Tax=Dyadobacter pollutisoli TaxID=2910158 RepID=A0A9E8NE27_9BACT|nr:FecR family protein [Dyadobacter pollutisoli]WAC13282.1 FecR domain-containing protein [Dyadobacter pollutisoli]